MKIGPQHCPLKENQSAGAGFSKIMKQGHFPFGTLNNGFYHVISKELYYFIASMDVGLV